VLVVGVNTAETSDPVTHARRFRNQHRLTYPILMDVDDRAKTLFALVGFPTNMIIDREGAVRYIESGFNGEAINAVLRELMAK
jgi:peroxiredoxin